MREVYLQSAFVHWQGPEKATRANARIEVVNLAGANGTGEQVHSDEGEGPVVSGAILTQVQAAHKAVVDLVGEPRLCAGG